MAPPSTPDKFPSSEVCLDDKTIQIIVGTGVTKTFQLHKGLLCYYSGYFEKALNGGFAEAKTGVVELPEEDVPSFTLFVTWIHRLKIVDETNDYKSLIKLWILADRRDVPLLMNACVDAIVEKFGMLVALPSLKSIYNETTRDSKLRKLAMHLVSHAGCSDLFADDQRDRWPQEAVWDFAKLRCNIDPVKDFSTTFKHIMNMDRCQFHVHEEGVNCKGKTTQSDVEKRVTSPAE